MADAWPAASSNRWLVIMVKEPRMGWVKTRLARDIGPTAATAFYRHLSDRLIRRLSVSRRWRTVLAVTPDTGLAAPTFRPGLLRVPQGPGDLGIRMQRLLDGMPPGPVLVIGTDIPGVGPLHIQQAFDRLGAHDAVLGSAGDGGYWLVGLKRSPRTPKIFTDVRWSTPQALSDTLKNLEGLDVGWAAELGDVDDARDYRRLGGADIRLVV